VNVTSAQTAVTLSCKYPCVCVSLSQMDQLHLLSAELLPFLCVSLLLLVFILTFIAVFSVLIFHANDMLCLITSWRLMTCCVS